MGLLRKTASVSTLGGVKYSSRREAQTKAAHAQARAADAEARLLREQAKTAKAERKNTAGQAAPASDAPWYRQPTLSAAIKAKRDQK